MVANQSTSAKLTYRAEDLAKMITKLHFDKNTKKSSNRNDWDESFRAALSTAGLTYFIDSGSSLAAPQEQVAELLMKRQAMEYMSEARKRRNEFAKLMVKEEDKSDDGSSSSSDDDEFEELLKKRVEKRIEANRKNRELAVKRGVRAETVFLNTFSCVPVGKAKLNPQATIEMEDEDGVLSLFEIEDEKMRFQRLVAWKLLVSSIKDVDKALWKHIPIGDVYSLYTLLTTNFLDTERDDVVVELSTQFSSLRKSEDELFVNFLSRYEALLVKMKEVDMQMGDALFPKK